MVLPVWIKLQSAEIERYSDCLYAPRVTFGHLIRFFRGSRSQGEIADRSGYSQTYISQLEQDRHSPTIEAAQKIARALGCDLEYLVHIWERTEGLAGGTNFAHLSEHEFAGLQDELARAIDTAKAHPSSRTLSEDDQILQLSASLDTETRAHLIGLLKKLVPPTNDAAEAAS